MEVDTAELLPSGHSVDSPDAKRQMGINIEYGVSVRAAYKTIRKRVGIEARRQRELEEGRPPAVLLESLLDLLKHKLRGPPEIAKRVLTSAAEAAKHGRAKDKRQRETSCWWIANGKECFNCDRCAFKHVVPQVKEQTASKTGVSPPGLATERDGNRTKVPLPRPLAQSMSCPSATQEFQKSAASVLSSSEEQEFKKGSTRDDWIKCWDECFSSDSWRQQFLLRQRG